MTGAEIAAIIAAGATTLSAGASAANSFRSLKKAKKYAKFQDELADENYQMQLADQQRLIEDERAYNDFGSVMARARAAGLNPLYAVGSPSTGGNITTSTPAHSGVSINGDDSAQHLQNATYGFSSVSSAMSDIALNRERIEHAEWENLFLKQTHDARVAAADIANTVQESVAQLNTAEASTKPAQKAYLDSLTALNNSQKTRIDSITPYEVENLAADFMNKTMDYINSELDADLKQRTLDVTVQQEYASLWETLIASKMNVYNAETSRMSVRESKRHNQAVEKFESEYKKAVSEYQNATIEYENDRNDINKQRIWVEAGFKVISVVVGAGAGFLIGGPPGAVYGAGAGLGIGSLSPFADAVMPQPERRPAGFRAN